MMKRLAPIAIGVVILGAFAWTLFFLYQKSQEKPVVFETATPTTADIVKKTVATGAIVPRHEVEVKPRVSGILEELYVEAGVRVEAGAPIAKIKIVPNVVSLNAAESQVAQARISADNARAEFQRNQTLFQQGLISDAELSRFRTEYELRRQELRAAQSNRQLLESGAARGSGKVSNVVTAPVGGMVVEVPVKVGDSVTETNNFNAGTTVAFVADMSDMIFEGKVDESEVGKLEEGMELSIVIGAIEGQRFQGALEYISPKGTELEGAIQFEIRAAIEQSSEVFIRANYSANADIVLERRDQVLALDEGLVQFDPSGKTFVEVETGPQEFERRDVELGLSDGVMIEVVSGIDADTVLKRPEGSPGRRGGRGRRG